MPRDPRITLLLDVYDQAFDHKAWHGTPLWGSLRGLTQQAALWRPGRGRHNIWEVVLHTAYWKYIVRRRLAVALDQRAAHLRHRVARSVSRGTDSTAESSQSPVVNNLSSVIRCPSSVETVQYG